VTFRQVPDVNHYTIVMGRTGASAVASEVLRLRERSQPTLTRRQRL